MPDWKWEYKCKKCGESNVIVMGNNTVSHACWKCGKLKFNSREYSLTKSGCIKKI